MHERAFIEGESEMQLEQLEQQQQSLIGEWRLSSTNMESYSEGLQSGWTYDICFFADGTGVEWWGSPDIGRHEAYCFTWSVSDGHVAIVMTAVNQEAYTQFADSGWNDIAVAHIEVPSNMTYSIFGNTLTLSDLSTTLMYQRN